MKKRPTTAKDLRRLIPNSKWLGNWERDDFGMPDELDRLKMVTTKTLWNAEFEEYRRQLQIIYANRSVKFAVFNGSAYYGSYLTYVFRWKRLPRKLKKELIKYSEK